VSNLETDPRETTCGGSVATAPELLTARPVALGGPRGMTVTRTLPNRTRRMVGAWCFLDAYGPEDLTAAQGMRVPPHPHTGLQTVSWLVAGEVLHHDSLGNEQLIRPGQLNLMTAGRGIAHSEQTPQAHSPVLQGVQLWVALPGADRAIEPDFAHHPDLPVVRTGGATVTVLMGEVAGAVSPARCFSPLAGAEVVLDAGAALDLPLRPEFEYAVLALSGTVGVDGVALGPGPLLYAGAGHRNLALRADEPARALLLGGEPFAEEIVMWWNFVGGDHEDIVRARADWAGGERFGVVSGYDGEPLAAPALPTARLKPRGRQA
jgi:quercetin 2,3-dioxygenase